MAIETVDFEVAPEDGWTLVATDPGYLVIKTDEACSWRMALTASGLPAGVATAEGVFTFAGQPNDTGTVTVGSRTYTFATNFNAPGADVVKIGVNQAASEAALTAAINGRAAIPATAATGQVIFGGLPVANETVTIGAEVYTFKASAALPFEVTIGADATATGNNLVTTITADSLIVSGVNVTGTVTLTADTAGYASNSIALAEAATNTTVSGAFLTGGNDIGPAISANAAVTAADGAGTVTVTAIVEGPVGNAIPLSENATNITVSGSGTLTGGANEVEGLLFGAGRIGERIPYEVGPNANLTCEVYVRARMGPTHFRVIRG